MSRDCSRKPPDDFAQRNAGRRRIGQAAGEQQAQILLRREDAARVGIGVGRDDHFGEDLGELLGGRAVERAVAGDDAAIGADRIAAQRERVGFGERLGGRDAARVGVLDDGDGGVVLGVELGDDFVGGVGVVDVVVGELLAADLLGGRDAEALAAGRVERGPLVRVFAVAQALLQLAAEREEGAAACALRLLAVRELAAEPVRDRGVVGRRARVGLGRERAARRERERAVVGSSSARIGA